MSGFQASRLQRARVSDGCCISCGAPGVDPAHVISRAQGGCDDPLCVVPLCRQCHNAYDSGRLDLISALEPHHRAEAAHAVLHLGLARAYRHISGGRWRDGL